MLSKARLKKYRKIKEGSKKLKFGASKTGVGGGGGWAPGAPPGSAPEIGIYDSLMNLTYPFIGICNSLMNLTPTPPHSKRTPSF